MVINDLLARARHAGLTIELQGDRVVIEAPQGLDALAKALRDREGEIHALLTRESAGPVSASSIGPEAPEHTGSADASPQEHDDTAVIARATAQLRALLKRADRIEAAAVARGETVPDPDDPNVDYWAWHDAQPDPPPADSGPWPQETVAVRADQDGRLVSGPLCDAEGREVVS